VSKKEAIRSFPAVLRSRWGKLGRDFNLAFDAVIPRRYMSILHAFDRRSWNSSGTGSERGSVRTVRLEPVMVVEPEDEHGDVIEGYI
jgi:hypothetical protein